MTRRRRKSRPQNFLLPMLILQLAYVAPFVILVGWLVAEYRAIRFEATRMPDSQQLLAAIGVAEDEIEEISRAGQDRGLGTRQDGMFDARSTDGRELNSAIYARSAEIEELQSLGVRLVQRDAARAAVVVWIAVFLYLWDVEFWRIIWAGAAAIATAAGTYFVRKGSYESS